MVCQVLADGIPPTIRRVSRAIKIRSQTERQRTRSSRFYRLERMETRNRLLKFNVLSAILTNVSGIVIPSFVAGDSTSVMNMYDEQKANILISLCSKSYDRMPLSRHDHGH
jgi:hypothetical protein